MTDVIDDSLSWEQRRELRRKKRQELLADAERLVQKPDTSASSQISQNDEDDSFEQERARRRKDREEKRRKERDEIEKQLKDEEEARSERERRREERRRQREEEGDSYVSQTYKSTSITKTELTTHDGDEDVVETTTTTEVNEYVTNGDGEYSTQNGEEAIENGDAEEEEERYEEEQEEEIVEEDEDTNMKTSSYTTSITVVSTKKVERHESSSSSESEAEEQEEEEQIEVIEEKPAPKSRSELIAERRKKREMEQLEEEKRKNEEAEKLKAEQEERRAAERAEREKRMAEGEAKRKELRKQISQDVEPLTAKGNTSSPLIMKSVDSKISNEDSASQSSSVKSTNKVQKGTRTKDTRSEMSSPAMKSQSFHVRSKTETPSRPLSRKNQTKRSLNALEKQAGDLYSFLSELEEHKSAGPEKLKEFLETSERSEKCGPEMKSLLENKNKSRGSVRDRMKQLGVDNKENPPQRQYQTSPAKQPSTDNRSSLKYKSPDINANTRSSPKPPTRSDSMKRLEVARSKYVNRSPDNKNDLNAPDDLQSPRRSPVENLSKVIEEDGILEISSSNQEKLSNAVLLNDTKTQDDKISFSEDIANPSTSEQDNAVQSYDNNATVDEDLNKTVDVANVDFIKKPSESTIEKSVEDIPTKLKEITTENESPQKIIAKETVQKALSGRVRSRRQKPELPQKPDSLNSSPIRSKKPLDENKTEKSTSVKVVKTNKQIEDSNSEKSKSSKIVNTEKSECSSVKEISVKEEDASTTKAVSRGTRSRRRNADKLKTSPEKTVQSTEVEKKEPSMKDLNSKISDSPKVSKQQNDTNIAKMSSLDDRLKSYTSRAQKQDSVKRSNVTPTTNTGVASRLNMWESGKVSGGSEKKKAVDTAVVKQGAGVSSRKNLWETGRVGTASAEKKSARADVHGADFSSRKNLWLKATQESAKASPGGKSGETQGLKTGVMSRLNKWEKGEVSHSTASIKQKSDLPASDVVNRRHKWENIAHDSPKETSKTKAVRPLVTTEVSSRKNLYESKAEASAQPKPVERKPRKEIVKEVVKEPESEEEQEEEEYVPQTKRKESVDSYSDESDERVLSDTDSEDQGKDYGRPATSGTDESDQDE